MKRISGLLCAAALLLPACGSAAPRGAVRSGAEGSDTGKLIVFAAASLTDAFEEIGADFEAANPGMIVTFNFAGSQTLRTQIEEGAPADVFASANTEQMGLLVADRLVASSAPRIFLHNELVVIVPPRNPAGIRSLRDLGRPGLKLDLAAADVPVGAYARQSLDRMNALYGDEFKAGVMSNVVSEEDNVKQVVAKVQLGEADAGIVYSSDAMAAPDVGRIAIPADLNVIAQYPIAALQHAGNPVLATQFADYVLSSRGQAILMKWGFQPVQ